MLIFFHRNWVFNFDKHPVEKRGIILGNQHNKREKSTLLSQIFIRNGCYFYY